MERNYSIEEILKAVNDLQTKKDIGIKKINPDKKNNSDIPKDTLKLIEEAEKLQKN